MKIITIPDLHGKSIWKSVEIDDYDKVIFLGDYVDSKGEVKEEEEIHNLEQVIKCKLAYPDKVELLLGNHDAHYLYYPLFRATGFNDNLKEILTSLYQSHKDLFRFAWQIENHLWTHAGVSNTWYQDNLETFAALTKADTSLEMADILNAMEKDHLETLLAMSPVRGGSAPFSGILWADKSETHQDFLPGFHQYVGHSRVKEITVIGDNASSINYLDCLNTEEKYFVLTV